jgi:hypothetical protein
MNRSFLHRQYRKTASMGATAFSPALKISRASWRMRRVTPSEPAAGVLSNDTICDSFSWQLFH